MERTYHDRQQGPWSGARYQGPSGDENNAENIYLSNMSSIDTNLWIGSWNERTMIDNAEN